MGAGPESAPAPRKILCIDYSAPANQREAWTRVGWTGVSWIRVIKCMTVTNFTFFYFENGLRELSLKWKLIASKFAEAHNL